MGKKYKQNRFTQRKFTADEDIADELNDLSFNADADIETDTLTHSDAETAEIDSDSEAPQAEIQTAPTIFSKSAPAEFSFASGSRRKLNAEEVNVIRNKDLDLRLGNTSDTEIPDREHNFGLPTNPNRQKPVNPDFLNDDSENFESVPLKPKRSKQKPLSNVVSDTNLEDSTFGLGNMTEQPVAIKPRRAKTVSGNRSLGGRSSIDDDPNDGDLFSKSVPNRHRAVSNDFDETIGGDQPALSRSKSRKLKKLAKSQSFSSKPLARRKSYQETPATIVVDPSAPPNKVDGPWNSFMSGKFDAVKPSAVSVPTAKVESELIIHKKPSSVSVLSSLLSATTLGEPDEFMTASGQFVHSESPTSEDGGDWVVVSGSVGKSKPNSYKSSGTSIPAVGILGTSVKKNGKIGICSWVGDEEIGVLIDEKKLMTRVDTMVDVEADGGKDEELDAELSWNPFSVVCEVDV